MKKINKFPHLHGCMETFKDKVRDIYLISSRKTNLMRPGQYMSYWVESKQNGSEVTLYISREV